MQDDKKAFEQYKEFGMNLVDKIIYHTRAGRYYRDGTFFSVKLKWWHPVSWLLLLGLLFMMLPVCLLTEMSVVGWWRDVRDCFLLKKWFRDNPERLVWFNPYEEG